MIRLSIVPQSCTRSRDSHAIRIPADFLVAILRFELQNEVPRNRDSIFQKEGLI